MVVVSTSTCLTATFGTIAMYLAGCACTTAKSLHTHVNSCDYVGEGPLGMCNNYHKHVPLLVIVVECSSDWLPLWLLYQCT